MVSDAFDGQPPGVIQHDELMVIVGSMKSPPNPSNSILKEPCFRAELISQNSVELHVKVPQRAVAIEIRQGTSQISRENHFSALHS